MTAHTAKTANQLASVALELCVRSKTGNLRRNFSDCFEMNIDSHSVIVAGLRKLATSERYRNAVRKCDGVPWEWRDATCHSRD